MTYTFLKFKTDIDIPDTFIIKLSLPFRELVQKLLFRETIY